MRLPTFTGLAVLAVLAVVGGVGAAVGLALTPSGDDVAQLVYIGVVATAMVAFSTIGYLYQRRREAIYWSLWRSRRLVGRVDALRGRVVRDDDDMPRSDVREGLLPDEAVRQEAQQLLHDVTAEMPLLIAAGEFDSAEALVDAETFLVGLLRVLPGRQA